MTKEAHTKETTVTQTNGRVPALPDDPYTAFGEANATGDTYLKFDRGVYRFGPADASEILALGTLLVANMPEMKVGWRKWQDGEVVATARPPAARHRSARAGGCAPVPARRRR